MTARLKGKKALVLGVSPDNLGAAIAQKFVSHGADVTIAGRRKDALIQIAEELGTNWVICDLTDEASIKSAVEDSTSKMGGLNVGVNSSGWGLLKPFLDNTKSDLDQMNAIQFTGPFLFFQALLQNMSGPGSIIQISSVTASIMFDDHAAYMGTKAGMDHVIRCIAHEFGHLGIRANSVAPGGIADAPMSQGGIAIPAIRDLYNREIPLQRSTLKEDVANTALWLASDESSFVSGDLIHVSGGQQLRRNPSIAEVYAAYGAQR